MPELTTAPRDALLAALREDEHAPWAEPTATLDHRRPVIDPDLGRPGQWGYRLRPGAADSTEEETETR